MANNVSKLAAILAPAVLAAGCATHTSQPYDYRALEASNPHSILVLPPLNNSPDVQATESMYSTLSYPLAEAGYYVLPVSLVSETFKQNGLTTAADIHNVDTEKLRQIFGADAALYMTVEKYGSSYTILSSVTTVAASVKLVDLKTKARLWDGRVTVVDDANRGNSGGGGGVLGALVKAAVTQIMNSALNRSHEVGARANAILLTAGSSQGLLYGPRSPKYKGRDASIPVAGTYAPPVTADLVVAAPAPRIAPVAAPAAPAPVATAAAQPASSLPVRPVAAVAPIVAQAMPAPEMPAPAPEAPHSAAEQRYADMLSVAQSRYQSLNPGSPWYRKEVYKWVMDRKDEYISAGKSPDVALKLALAAMEGH